MRIPYLSFIFYVFPIFLIARATTRDAPFSAKPTISAVTRAPELSFTPKEESVDSSDCTGKKLDLTSGDGIYIPLSESSGSRPNVLSSKGTVADMDSSSGQTVNTAISTSASGVLTGPDVPVDDADSEPEQLPAVNPVVDGHAEEVISRPKKHLSDDTAFHLGVDATEPLPELPKSKHRYWEGREQSFMGETERLFVDKLFSQRKAKVKEEGAYVEKSEDWVASDIVPENPLYDFTVWNIPRCAGDESLRCCDGIEWDELRSYYLLSDSGRDPYAAGIWNTGVAYGCVDAPDFDWCPETKINACCFQLPRKIETTDEDEENYKVFNGEVVAGCLPAIVYDPTDESDIPSDPTTASGYPRRPHPSFWREPPMPIQGIDRRIRFSPVVHSDGVVEYTSVEPPMTMTAIERHVNPLIRWREIMGYTSTFGKSVTTSTATVGAIDTGVASSGNSVQTTEAAGSTTVPAVSATTGAGNP